MHNCRLRPSYPPARTKSRGKNSCVAPAGFVPVKSAPGRWRMEGDAHMVARADDPPRSFAHRRWLTEYRFRRGDWTDEDEAICQSRCDRRRDVDGDALAPYAEALGGEINSAFVVFARLTVQIDAANPISFFVSRRSISSLAAAQALSARS